MPSKLSYLATRTSRQALAAAAVLLLALPVSGGAEAASGQSLAAPGAGKQDAAMTDKQQRSRRTREEMVDALLSIPLLSSAEVSPDGRWAAWTWYGCGPGADVYAAPTDGSAAPVRLTETAEDTHVVSWAPDSKSVLVAEDRSGDERMRLYQVDLGAPAKMRLLTDADPSYYLSGGQIHPNGRWLVYGADFDFAAGREIEPTWIYRHDLVTGERKVLARPERGGSPYPRLNKPGTQIIYTRNDIDPAGEQVWLVDVEGRRDREILNFGPSVKVRASWFPDGKRVLFLAEAGTYRRLGVWSLESGTSRWLLDDPKRNIEAAFVPDGSEDIVLVEQVRGRPRASFLDPSTGKETPLAPRAANLVPLAPAAGGLWVGRFYSATQPADLVLFQRDAEPAEDLRTLTRVWERTTLKPDDFTPAQDFTWKSSDGTEIHGWLYRARQPLGTIVYIHGGPTGHHEDRLDPEVQFYVWQGFNVLDPNYRGSTGYGLAFQEKIKEDGWGGREQDDIRSGIEALLSLGIAQPGKVGVTGTSYGGYSSWCAITRCPPEVVAAAAPICGMTDLVVDYETTRPDLRPYSEEMMGGSPAVVPERYRERSPISHIANIRGRLLIVQGARDPNVTPENVRRVEAELMRLGKRYEVLAFEDEGHGVYKPRNERVLLLRLADFFADAFAAAPVTSASPHR